MKQPSISVLIVNLNGRMYLESCLPSLFAQEYPRDRFEVVLVDNASTDDSVAFTRERFPDVRVIRHERNLGFAGAYQAAVQDVSSEYLAFLNNDTRVDTSWLREMVEAGARHDAQVVASKIVDWSGEKIDFAGGILTLTGHAWQRDNGQPSATHGRSEIPLLFACAGSMLVERDAFERAGGFDADYFAYFEDVDLGWRLSLLGSRTVLAPKAITYHRLHGTAGKSAFSPRLRLYERNALYTIYKCLGDEALNRVLPVAVALTLARGLRPTSLDSTRFNFGASLPADIPVSPQTVATLLALEDFARHLPRLEQKRVAVQSSRTRTDAELFPLFGEPLKVHEHGDEYVRLARELYEEFGLVELVSGANGRAPGADRPARGVQRPAPNAEHATPSVQSLAPGSESRAPSFDLPTISVIILTALGSTHLGECLASLAGGAYPADKLDIIIVDNGSAVDPTADVASLYPAANVIRLDRNIGFCGGNNLGARAARGEWLFILNDDTRLHPDCLSELVATAQRRGATSVGARILDWTGEHLDFGGAAVNFEGRGFQVGIGSSAADAGEERPMLFGCGAALLVRREAFLELGGFDEAMFAYYEDLALGWQLWIRGYDCWLSPRAIVYHKHHGTSGIFPEPPRVRLYERNGLRIVFTLLESGNVGRALAASLLLAAERSVITSHLNHAPGEELARFASPLRRFYWRAKPAMLWHHTRTALVTRGATRQRGIIGNIRHMGLRLIGAAFWSTATFVMRDEQRDLARRAGYLVELGLQPHGFDGRQEPFPARGAAILVALKEWLESIPEQRRRRAQVQDGRRRSDRDVLGRFSSHWTDPVGTDQQAAYEQLHWALVRTLKLGEITK